MITLKQLEAIYWVAKLGGVGEAAHRLNTTQSAISKRLQEGEYALGVDIFDRNGRRILLTEDGTRLLPQVSEVLYQRDRLMDAVHPQHDIRTLRLGVTELTAITWLPRLLTRIRESYPGATVTPVVDGSISLMQKLRDGSVDAAIVPNAFETREIETTVLSTVELKWLRAPTYAPGLETLTPEELRHRTVIGQRDGSGLGSMVEAWLTSLRVTIDNEISTSSFSAQLALTLSGLGIAYLPARICEHFVQSGRLVALQSSPPLPPIPYGIHYLKSAGDDFLRHVVTLGSECCDFDAGNIGLP
ncbi:LysR family transcriptional regulator [Puniceibacterium sp. IMCC21224]|uniref:LysR family transcriptional regulator n=1 Tax=Puniceibacterium sp. IMCC21224 TaxID=1618204 RepID=UPI00064DB03E|nr:LysR family transcriptional regulator [Puniceibacterium sp. IMCC21224]KMK69043.1 transcriptional regulator [Puniceibacterium sp. IMCC21224]